MQLVYLDDFQTVDALAQGQFGQFEDVTSMTEGVVHVPLGQAERIRVVWSYCYYRVPITAMSMPPECLGRDHKRFPPPTISHVAPVLDPTTGKQIGIEFDLEAVTEDSWQCNCQVECTYFEQLMGREYTHRRMASFTVSSQVPIDKILETLK